MWFWVSGVGSTLVKVYSAGVYGFGCNGGQSLQCRGVWFWVSGVGATLVKVYSADVCGFGCMIWVLQWSEFTVQMCVVLGKWCQSLQCRCVWFWVHDTGFTLVKVYNAGVCGLGYMVWVLHWTI